MKKLALFLLVFCFIFLFLGCNEKLEISGSNTLELGCSQKLEININKKEICWSSSDDSIASVVDGLVIANSLGTVTIYATLGDEKASFEIEVVPTIFDVIITGYNNIFVGETYKFEYQLSKEVDASVTWSVSNDDVISVDQEGNVKGLKPGTAEVILNILNKEERFEVEVKDFGIALLEINKLKIGTTFQTEVITSPADINAEFVFKSSNVNVATIDENGLITAVGSGKTIISCTNKNFSSQKVMFSLEVVDYEPIYVSIKGNNNIIAGEHSILDFNVTGSGSKELKWESSDTSVAICYQGIVLGLKSGKTTIKATSVEDKTATATIEITVEKYQAEEVNKEDLEKVNGILNKMTLSQKVGQMFVVGFNGTSMPNNLVEAIEEYNFGNVIYMGYNVTSPSTLTKLSNDIQNVMVSKNSVPAFISTDQEGGRVARLTNGGTHFISQMAMAATNDYNNTYLEALATGKELLSYGINTDFAPVLDVNNNPNNPIIGIRSYADNPAIVALYGNNAINGFKEANVLCSSKHFPGHGNTSVDSHSGLPVITSTINELYSIELAPFISSITNGIDAIMTTHIIFQAIDKEYPATLSQKVLTDLLRDELGYDGLIITDGMEMDAVAKYYGSYAEVAVLAVKAGVDILTYTSLSNPQKAHQGIMQAIKNGEITEDRINESVRRILLTKLQYGILDNYITEDTDRTEMLAEHDELNLKFAMDSLTLVKGDFKGLDKTKSTLIVSPTLSESLGGNLTDNSFANYAAKYLKEQGHSKVDYRTVKTNMSTSQVESILAEASNYDQIVIALSNVKTSSYKNSANFVKDLVKKHNNVIVIALDTPYDYLSYGTGVNNYICIYGYQKISTIALTKYLNGEFEAKGVLPIDKQLYE